MVTEVVLFTDQLSNLEECQSHEHLHFVRQVFDGADSRVVLSQELSE